MLALCLSLVSCSIRILRLYMCLTFVSNEVNQGGTTYSDETQISARMKNECGFEVIWACFFGPFLTSVSAEASSNAYQHLKCPGGHKDLGKVAPDLKELRKS